MNFSGISRTSALGALLRLPLRLIPSLLSAVNLLAADYSASVVFGSATQPAFLSASGAIEGGWAPVEINPGSREMAIALRRTGISIPPQKSSWVEIARSIAKEGQVLCIVNLKRHAAELFRMLGESEGVFHLSTNLCPEHRRRKLAAIRGRLLRGEPPSVPVRSARTEALDRVFLSFLERQPARGPAAFRALFDRVPAEVVVRFLSERSSPAEELRVMLASPIGAMLGEVARAPLHWLLR